jgi:alkylated DNA repair dioxygenase AlkB
MEHANLLPCDGEVAYIPAFFDQGAARWYVEILSKEIAWKNDEVLIYGKRITTKREVAWYGERDFDYTYSKSSRKALPWTPALLEIKTKIESLTGEPFNCCLLNLYHDGSEGMGWHSDDEKEMKPGGMIASLSLGAARKFKFKHKKDPLQKEIYLENGSLLLMSGETQQFWRHQLPVSKKVKEARINLTFRTFVDL